MPKEIEKKSAEYKAGLFIIIALAMLTFSILWLRYFAIRPVMTIIAEFKDPGAITKGLQAYYQGVNIGRVSNIDFSKDFRYTLVYISIYKKDLILPANVTAKIESQGITGQKIVSIYYPEQPVSKILCDGCTIAGEKPFDLSDLQEIIGKQVKNGRLQKMIDDFDKSFELQEQLSINMEKLANNANILIEENRAKIRVLIGEGTKSATNLNKILSNVNEVIGDPETKQNIKSTVKTASCTTNLLKDILKSNEFSNSMANVNEITQNISEITSDKELRDNLKNTFKLLGEASNAFSSFKSSGLSGKTTTGGCSSLQSGSNIIDLAVDTLYNTNQAAKSVNCLSQGMSDIFNKRFALIRLLFGRPGSSLEECKTIGKMSKEQIDFLIKQGVVVPSCSCK
ncbi:MAG: MlaD family protein [Candidatus Gastranaerophilales bacterium]|nr:MlaD family protein [Candidatus Gastranaerophilales bacterium]